MNAARLLVCYGGTFDPVHEGHLAVARSARDALDADVALVPARDPPHKGPTRADAAQRARMLELAVAGEAGLSVDLRELHREGPSYTFASLGELRAELGDAAPIAWLVGADSLLQLHTWHRWRELFDRAHIVAVQRPGSQVDARRLLLAEGRVEREAERAEVPIIHLIVRRLTDRSDLLDGLLQEGGTPDGESQAENGDLGDAARTERRPGQAEPGVRPPKARLPASRDFR